MFFIEFILTFVVTAVASLPIHSRVNASKAQLYSDQKLNSLVVNNDQLYTSSFPIPSLLILKW